MSIFLSHDDVSALTGRKTKAKQFEMLLRMRLPFWVNAIGRPVVTLAALEGGRDSRPECAWAPTRKNRG